MRSEDFAFAVELSNTMSWNMASEDFEFNSLLEPNGCFILLKDKERIGLSTCISYGKVGWFGNLIVKEAYRMQGAGALLVNHAVSYLKRTGVNTIGLYAYNYLADFYAGIGFNRDIDYAVLRTNRIATSTIIESNEKLKRIEQSEISGVLDFDQQFFGAQRNKTLAPIFQNANNLCYTALDNGKVVGYIASKVFDEMVEIGPLVCIDKHPSTAASLLQAVFSKLKRQKVYLYLSATETGLLNIAYKAGFREDFFLARMFLGSAVAQNGVYAAESLERG